MFDKLKNEEVVFKPTSFDDLKSKVAAVSDMKMPVKMKVVALMIESDCGCGPSHNMKVLRTVPEDSNLKDGDKITMDDILITDKISGMWA